MLFVLLVEYLDIEDKPESVKKEFIIYEVKDTDELKKDINETEKLQFTESGIEYFNGVSWKVCGVARLFCVNETTGFELASALKRVMAVKVKTEDQ
jgi:hypothetical protein